ncbi:MAG: hypothetical protein QOE65_199 [Solirubrobacteraceae bacterium]|nr:hypothetical protein [Solirubrobacteraceae bacterium]
MTPFRLRLLIGVVLIVPAVVLTSVAETAFRLGPNATFALLMALGFVAALGADSIARARETRAGARRRR